MRPSEPTHGTIGLVRPTLSNAVWTVLRNVTVTGYDTGILVNEHTDGDTIVIGGIVIGGIGAKDVFLKTGGESIQTRRIGSPLAP